MRIVKEAEERKNEILDVADQLFNEKGYEKTSTNEILERVGIARGTLYYHFKSKQDILEALVERYNKEIIQAAKTAAKCENASVTQRMVKVIKALNIKQYHEENDAVYQNLHHVENSLLHQRVQGTIIASVTPILAELVEEGVREGIFATTTPYGCMEMAMIYATTLLDNDLLRLSEEEKQRRMQEMVINMARMLGCDPKILEAQWR